MSACEKCWRDATEAAVLRGVDTVDEYHRLLEERAGHPCSPEEQRGTWNIQEVSDDESAS